MKNIKLKLLFSIIILMITGVLVSRLSIESNMEDMLPEDSESLAAARDFEQYFDGDDQVFVVVKETEGDLNSEDYHLEAEEFLDSLNNKLKDEPYIDSILYRISQDEVKPFAWAYIDIKSLDLIDEQIEHNNLENVMTMMNEFSIEMKTNKHTYIENDNKTHYLLIIKPNIDAKDFVNSRMVFYDGVYAHLNQTLPEFELIEAGITGGAFIQDLEGDSVAFNGFFSTLVITLILILIIVILFFGSLKLPLLSMYPLLLGAMIAAASAYLIYGSLNMFSISFALLLVGLGIDFAVHLIARYQEERQKGVSLEQSIQVSIKSTGSSIVVGAVTTAFAFGTFAFAQFKAFEQMGIISAIGLMALCVMMIVLIPVLINISDKKYKGQKAKKSLRGLEIVTQFNQKHSVVIISIIVILIAILLPNVLKMEVQSDLTAVYPEDIPSTKWTNELKSAFDYDPNTITFYADNMNELTSMKSELEALEFIAEVDSIVDYLPEDSAEKLVIMNKLSQILSAKGLDNLDEFNLSVMTYEDLPTSIQDNFIGKEGRLRGEIVPAINIYNDKQYQQLLKQVIRITGKHPVGLPTIMNEVTILVKEDMILISGLCIVVIFFVAWFAFKKLSLAMLAVFPLLITLYLTIGLLPIVGVEINIFSIAAFPLIIGIGIDSAIHLIHRLKEESDLSIAVKVRETGKPIILTGLTTMVGFGSLANINHPGMSNLGLTVAIGIGISMIITLIIIPIGFKIIKK